MPTARLNGKAGERVVATKHMFVAAAAVVVFGTSAVWNNAAAQQSPDASTNIQRTRDSTANARLRLQAPIGHRQPRADDLPASVLRDEESPPAGNTAIDRDLRICRNC